MLAIFRGIAADARSVKQRASLDRGYDSMQVSHVKYFQNWIPIIGKWIYEEWSYAFPLRTLQEIQKTLFGRMNENEMPITLIAHDERGVLGTASLKASDMDILP